jgi:hypothetical protein
VTKLKRFPEETPEFIAFLHSSWELPGLSPDFIAFAYLSVVGLGRWDEPDNLMLSQIVAKAPEMLERMLPIPLDFGRLSPDAAGDLARFGLRLGSKDVLIWLQRGLLDALEIGEGARAFERYVTEVCGAFSEAFTASTEDTGPLQDLAVGLVARKISVATPVTVDRLLAVSLLQQMASQGDRLLMFDRLFYAALRLAAAGASGGADVAVGHAQRILQMAEFVRGLDRPACKTLYRCWMGKLRAAVPALLKVPNLGEFIRAVGPRCALRLPKALLVAVGYRPSVMDILECHADDLRVALPQLLDLDLSSVDGPWLARCATDGGDIELTIQLLRVAIVCGVRDLHEQFPTLVAVDSEPALASLVEFVRTVFHAGATEAFPTLAKTLERMVRRELGAGPLFLQTLCAIARHARTLLVVREFTSLLRTCPAAAAWLNSDVEVARSTSFDGQPGLGFAQGRVSGVPKLEIPATLARSLPLVELLARDDRGAGAQRILELWALVPPGLPLFDLSSGRRWASFVCEAGVLELDLDEEHSSPVGLDMPLSVSFEFGAGIHVTVSLVADGRLFAWSPMAMPERATLLVDAERHRASLAGRSFAGSGLLFLSFRGPIGAAIKFVPRVITGARDTTAVDAGPSTPIPYRDITLPAGSVFVDGCQRTALAGL